MHERLSKCHEQDLLFASTKLFESANVIALLGQYSQRIGIVVWVISGEVDLELMYESLDRILNCRGKMLRKRDQL